MSVMVRRWSSRVGLGAAWIAATVSAIAVARNLGNSSGMVFYALDRELQAARAIVVIGPLAACTAALDARVITELWGRLTVHRDWQTVVARALAPRAAQAIAALASSYVFFLWGHDSLAGASIAPVAVNLLQIVSLLLFGLGAGLWLRPAFAAPLALVVPFAAMSYPISMNALWVRHLTGLFMDCCSTGSVLAWRAVSGPVLVNLSVALVALVAISVRLGGHRIKVARSLCGLAAAGTLVVVSIEAVHDVGPFPSAPRSSDELRCRNDVCLWPEEEATIRVANELAWARLRVASESLGVRLAWSTISSEVSLTSPPLVVQTASETTALVSMIETLPAWIGQRCSESAWLGLVPVARSVAGELASAAGVLDEVESHLGGSVGPSSDPAADLSRLLECRPPEDALTP